jgi:hypothetical protein
MVFKAANALIPGSAASCFTSHSVRADPALTSCSPQHDSTSIFRAQDSIDSDRAVTGFPDPQKGFPNEEDLVEEER